MKRELHEALLACETDIDGALKRFYGNEELYLSFLEAFIKETTMSKLSAAIDDKDWANAFLCAHALKGLAGNLGFVPLFHSLGELIVIIRSGKTKEIQTNYIAMKDSYRQIIDAIQLM